MSPVAHPPPPYVVRTERLIIRCWQPADAVLLKDALDTSLDHLRPWMPWAAEEPKPLAEKAELLRTFRGRFDLGEDFVYGIFDRAQQIVIGGTGLHTRVGAGALEIGYWIRASEAGRGYARESTAALTTAAIRVCGVDRVEIHVDPANETSLRVPLALGLTKEATLRRRLPAAGGGPARDVVVFTLFSDELDASPAAATFDAYDALGQPIALDLTRR